MNPVTVAEVRAHIAFLRAVHVSSSRGEGSLLADGTRLRAAVRAYIPWLAFHAARASNGRAVLVERAPPLDAAWDRMQQVNEKTGRRRGIRRSAI